MPSEDKDDIEELKRKLYSRQKKETLMSDIRTPLSSERPEAPIAWQEEKKVESSKPKRPPLAPFENKKKMSFAAKFLIWSLLFFLCATGVAAYIFFIGNNLISPQNIDLQIVLPSLVDSGKDTSFQIVIDNRNTSSLNLVDLLINYPDGTRDPANPTQTLSNDQQSVGTINAGQSVTQTANALFYGQEGAQETVNVTLEYSLTGSNAIFEKQAQAQFVIGSSPVSLSINAPTQAIVGQQFPIAVTVENNATTPLAGVVVQGEYPFGYSFASSNPAAQAGGTFWNLGNLAPGASQVINLLGSIEGQNGQSLIFKFLAGSNADPTDTTVDVPLLTVPVTVTLSQPFISGTIAVNGQTGPNISVAPGGQLQGTITWQNNLPTAVSNAQFSLSFSGPALDPSSISSQTGFYQSQDNTITWGSSQDPTLATIQPGGTGTLQFSFGTLPAGSGNVLVTNPTITLNLSVTGNETGGSGTSEQVTSAASATVSLASAVSLTAQALHFTGPITNTGPMPPVPGQNTSYTIVWTVQNSSNPLANTTVSTVLPTYVTYVSTGASGVSYDDGSRTVTWSLGDVEPGVGYSLPAQTANFQVVLTPSTSQVGSVPELTGETELSGEDRFAQVGVSASAQAPTTDLTGDTGFQSGMEVVAPN
jgi:hypothetical protein